MYFMEDKIEETHSLDNLRRTAHKINYELSAEKYSPREIEVIGYYLHRIAASYLSYKVHKELNEGDENGEFSFEKIVKKSNKV